MPGALPAASSVPPPETGERPAEVPDGFAPVEPKMKRQADDLSEEWVHLYNEGKAARTGIYAGRV